MNDVVSYLIISDPSFENSLESFIEWKKEKGSKEGNNQSILLFIHLPFKKTTLMSMK